MRITVDAEIVLKPIEMSNSEDIFNTIDTQREYLGEWLPFVDRTQEVADTQRYVGSVVEVSEGHLDRVFVIVNKGEFAGIIGFKDTDDFNKKTEIGYWLSEKFQKHGIMTKSVAKLCDVAFNEFGMNRIQIKCAVGNHPSSNIPKRLGFQFEGIERQGEILSGNVFTDLEIYSMLKND